MATKNQQKVLDIVKKDVRKGNKVSISKAMRESGVYSDDFARQPTRLTKSKGWKEIVEEQMPDSFIAKRHRALFDQKKVEYFSFDPRMDDEEIRAAVKDAGLTVINISRGEKAKLAWYSTADTHAVTKALEMAHKIKGVYMADKTLTPQVTINHNLFYNPDFQTAMRAAEATMKAAITNAKPTQEDSEAK